MNYECFEMQHEGKVAHLKMSRPERRIAAKAPVAVAATKEMISFARDHSVAASFSYLNALQPGVFSIEDIQRSVAAKGGDAQYADLPALRS